MLILLAEREWVSNNSVGLETLQCRRTMSSVVIILAVNIATVINQQNKHTTFTVSKKTNIIGNNCQLHSDGEVCNCLIILVRHYDRMLIS